MPNLLYLIWSYEHKAWWRPGERGYTSRLDQAGLYPKTKAFRIVESANKFRPPDKPYEVAIAIFPPENITFAVSAEDLTNQLQK